MQLKMLSITLVVIAVASGSLAQVTGTYPAVPLISKHYASPADLPYKVDTDTGLVRGQQTGYNICNSTTENQQSLCQTFYFNAHDDFCLTAPPNPGKTVADQEGEMVAWCSKKGHGTRLIPNGAIKGLEFRKTPDYIQIVGKIDQTLINIPEGDYGGEMDSGGADGRGNPMGGVFFSTAWGGSSPIQASHWTCFMGGDMFGCKACDPSKSNPRRHCEHIYDRIGIVWNMPSNAKEGEFVSCDADNAEFVGVYTSNGQVLTYTQPPESLGAISTMPYTPTIPPSSNCKTFASTQLFAALPTGSSSGSTSGTITGSGGSSKPTGSASATGSGSAGAKPTDSGAEAIAVSAAASVLGVLFAALFLA
ncbi:hypothetical protein CPB83DRAFT_863218 [Crepidotus variabilis]|uniref:Uncharacterized protein n=1 Tax=Crepidotus variabilis TaxID=179855 RepID=A0A9P6E635_9AGAR|nr:hypothetical protein CPB83DRAFT_863218 [Crepidotus variabilis]